MKISKTTWAAIGGGMLGALVLAALAPVAIWAVQTYVIPGTPTPREEIVTNIPNRDEALRSCFSGTAAPTSPAPVAGQCWYNTTTNEFRWYNGTAWVALPNNSVAQLPALGTAPSPARQTAIVDSEITSITTRSKLPMELVYHDEPNNFGGAVQTFSATVANLFTGTLASNHTAGNACASGYTRVGLWCYDTDGDLALIRSAAADEGANTSTVINASAKAVMVKVAASATNDATANAATVTACTYPGDSGVISCPGSYASVAVFADLANEASNGEAMYVIRTDSTGAILTRCKAGTGLASLGCSWRTVAYLD